MTQATVNMLTVDVEDWQQSTLDSTLPISGRVLASTRRLLGILAEARVKGTFFFQGMVAERYPELVEQVAAEGHEVASHGDSHTPIFHLSPTEFAQETDRSLALLRNQCSHAVIGYRAPDFSIRPDTMWALDVLIRAGIRYDSSVFPFRGIRYGIPSGLTRPYVIKDGLLEVPLATIRFAGTNWPVAGGGYFRLPPYFLTRWAIRRINAEGRPAVVYLHPYELDDREMYQFRGRIPWSLYWSQSLNRSRTEPKIRSLLRDFRFAPIREVVA